MVLWRARRCGAVETWTVRRGLLASPDLIIIRETFNNHDFEVPDR